MYKNVRCTSRVVVLLIQTYCFLDVLGAVAVAVAAAVVDAAKLPNISYLPKVYIFERTQQFVNKSKRYGLLKWTTRVALF